MNGPIDMSRFIEAKSDQLNADDLIGGPRTIVIRGVSANDGDQPVNIYFEGDNGKPFRPCKTIRRVMVGVWGADASKYAGRAMTIYRDDEVQFGGMKVGGIRISHMSHIDETQTVVVMKTKGKKAPMRILPLKNAAKAAPSRAPDSHAPPAAASESSQHDAGPGAASSELEADDPVIVRSRAALKRVGECVSAAELEHELLTPETNNAFRELEKAHPALWDKAQERVGRRRALLAEALADVPTDA